MTALTAVIELGLTCRQQQISLIAPLRLDARLFESPSQKEGPTVGRPWLVGERLPPLEKIAFDPDTIWQQATLNWYGGNQQTLDWVSGTALWYSTGTDPLPLRWVLVRDPTKRLSTRAFFSTDLAQDPLTIITDFVKRWAMEVTFEESRAHLGVETQRQWSDKAIARTTPVLLGLFSWVVLVAEQLDRLGHPVSARQSAWYAKTRPTFSDALAVVRQHLWQQRETFLMSSPNPDMVKISRPYLDTLVEAACYAA